MCGLVGVFDWRERRMVSSKTLHTMAASLTHRGPDGDGFYEAPGIGLGHRRLSIIDLEGGAQPMLSADGSVVLVFNGEIYNFQALRKELEACGHRFRTNSDTEAIIYAWQQWGVEALDKLRGMFAFALWDQRQQCLFLARDRLGIKPMYYSRTDDGQLLFGSELKALLCHPGVNRNLDHRAVEDYFAFGHIPDPRTIYTGVYKLPPGHFLLARRGETPAAPRQYWDLPIGEQGDPGVETAAGELLALLEESVALRMIADVPLGAFLSGGVDSSSVVAVMAGLMDRPVTTCSIEFDVEAFNEGDYSRQVAELFGTDHHIDLARVDIHSLLGRLPDVYDEPYADSSALPTMLLSSLTRTHVKVALSGDGGDEVFGGYDWYAGLARRDHWRQQPLAPAMSAVFRTAAALYPDFRWMPGAMRKKGALQRFFEPFESQMIRSAMISDRGLRNRLYSEQFSRSLQGYDGAEVVRQYLSKASSLDVVSAAQYVDSKLYLPSDILTKVDRASMASSLEVRVPLLDHVLVEWATRLPAHLKVNGDVGKYILKKAMTPQLPDNILHRQKRGFSVPLVHWFTAELRQHVIEVFESSRLVSHGIMQRKPLMEMVTGSPRNLAHHSSFIWAVLCFEAFLKRHH